MKISVIVPVYKVYDYLEKCLNSIVNQTFKDYEIIVVNDGSPDNSQVIIDKFVKKYSFVHGYRKENGGLSSARNYGLKYAKGEYIAFVDSDDTIEPNMLEEMYKKAKEDNSDIVLCDYWSLEEKGNRYMRAYLKMSDDSKKEYLLAPPNAWIRLIRKSILDKEKFTEGLYYEDLDISPRLLKHANKISFVEKPLYDYFVREGSIMGQKTFNERLLDIFKVLENNKRELEKDYPEELEYLYITHLLRTTSLRFVSFPNTSMYLEKINNIMKTDFPNWNDNIYYKKSSKKMKLICFCAIHKLYFILRIMKRMTGRR